MTLAEAIAKCLEDGSSGADGGAVFPEDRAFLNRWADALGLGEWKRNARKFANPEKLVEIALGTRCMAQHDDTSVQRWEEHCATLLKLAYAAQLLADNYITVGDVRHEWHAMDVDDEEVREQQIEENHESLKESREWLSRRVAKLRREYDVTREQGPYLSYNINLSTKTAERERMLFMQHMSRKMKSEWGSWHDTTVAAITELMYQVSVSWKAVERARSR
jgi:hypothetical protein